MKTLKAAIKAGVDEACGELGYNPAVLGKIENHVIQFLQSRVSKIAKDSEDEQMQRVRILLDLWREIQK